MKKIRLQALNMADDAEDEVFENNAIPLPNVAKQELERVSYFTS